MIFRHLLNMRSHPTWVRGLKLIENLFSQMIIESHPTWVRGLKLLLLYLVSAWVKSHPTWVRGLKHTFA